MKIAVLNTGKVASQAALNYFNHQYPNLGAELMEIGFDRLNALLPGPSKELTGEVQGIFDHLSKKGYSHIIVPNVTLFFTIEKVKIPESLNYINPLNELSKINPGKLVCIISSKYLAESSLWQGRFTSQVEFFFPEIKDIQWFDEIRRSTFTRLTKKLESEFTTLLKKYKKPSDLLIIACSEFSVYNYFSDQENVVDLIKLQVDHLSKEM